MSGHERGRSVLGLDEAIGEVLELVSDRRGGGPHGLVEDLQALALGVEGLAVRRAAGGEPGAGRGDRRGPRARQRSARRGPTRSRRRSPGPGPRGRGPRGAERRGRRAWIWAAWPNRVRGGTTPRGRGSCRPPPDRR